MSIDGSQPQSIPTVRLRGLSHSDMDFMRINRNDPRIWRGTLGSSDPTSREEQYQWFDALDISPSSSVRYWMGINAKGIRVGCFQLNQICWRDKEAFLGMWVTPSLQGRGYGNGLLRAGIYKSFVELELASLLLEVAESNQRAIAVYKAHGFQVTKRPVGSPRRGYSPESLISMQLDAKADGRLPIRTARLC